MAIGYVMPSNQGGDKPQKLESELIEKNVGKLRRLFSITWKTTVCNVYTSYHHITVNEMYINKTYKLPCSNELTEDHPTWCVIDLYHRCRPKSWKTLYQWGAFVCSPTHWRGWTGASIQVIPPRTSWWFCSAPYYSFSSSRCAINEYPAPRPLVANLLSWYFVQSFRMVPFIPL